MKKKSPLILLLCVVALLLTAQAGAAQQNFSNAEEARQTLTTFPDSQLVWYVNARRITADALPRIVPHAKLQEAFGGMKKTAGFDITSVHHVILGARIKEDAPLMTIPDVVVIIKGDFSADALVSMMKLAGNGMYREETYGTRTLNVFEFNKDKKPEATNTAAVIMDAQDGPPSPPTPQTPFTIPQVAVTALDANTILLGVTPYVKAAIDARDNGQGRLRPEFLELATREPDTLVSFVGEIPASAAKYLQMAGMGKNDEMTKLAASIKRVQAAITMRATDFGVHTAIGTDTAEHARALHGMISMGLNVARGAIEKDIREDTKARRTKDLEAKRTVLAIVNSMTNTVNENEIRIASSVPQTTVAALVRAQNTPKATATTARRPRAKSARRKR